MTWTSHGLCNRLDQERGVRVSAAWLSELLRRVGFRWKRSGPLLPTARRRSPALCSPAAGWSTLGPTSHRSETARRRRSPSTPGTFQGLSALSEGLPRDFQPPNATSP
ncbi:winged helix-turn-helix domain-containing protein [Streptomyces hygroscopicus]|uniref:winged helix-turn-helix domain-containing protein n=1 Tax=Streptomyces hygroscopicus TaxID=1912 RepID=UPI003A101165